MFDLSPSFSVDRPVFDGSPDGIVDQINRALRYLEREYVRECNADMRGALNHAYDKLTRELLTRELRWVLVARAKDKYVSTSIQ